MGKPLKPKKKRKADRTFLDDPENEMSLPVRSTAEIADTHANMPDRLNKGVRHSPRDFGTNENGKELFDTILLGMSSPDSPQD